MEVRRSISQTCGVNSSEDGTMVLVEILVEHLEVIRLMRLDHIDTQRPVAILEILTLITMAMNGEVTTMM
jgi:hypothetical protein